MELLVTGGTGFLGRHLAQKLLCQGHRVRLMGRDFREAQPLLAQGAVPLRVDLRDTARVEQACEGVDAVFHVGAKSEPWGRRADFLAINALGTQAVVAGCLAHGVGRLIYVSSPSVVFDGHDQHEADETAPYPTRFSSVYSYTKKLGEDYVNAARDHLQTVILRPKAMFGPGDRALLPRLIAAAWQGRLPQIGDGLNLVDLTYVENVVHALILALSAPAATGKIYTITNGEHVPLWQLIREALVRLGIPSRLRQIPLPLALAAATAMEFRAAITGHEPTLTRYAATILARTQTYTISAAQRDLGYVPQVSIAEGIERTLAALQAIEFIAAK
jgi:nucleoside-diphosphate-sugar epimerase